MKKNTIQWAIYIAIVTWGLLSFIVLAGEEDANNIMPFGRFLLIKLSAMLSLILCVFTGKWLSGKGLLPEDLNED